MSSEQKQYAVLQNVIFYEHTNTMNNNYNFLPISQYSTVVDTMPSTSEAKYAVQDVTSSRDNSTCYADHDLSHNRNSDRERNFALEPVYSASVKAIPNDLNSETKLSPMNNLSEKPALSFVCLIGLAFRNNKDECLAVKDVYDFVEAAFPFYRTANVGWRSSIRHNLSFSDYFLKVATEKAAGKTRGYIWRINPEKEAELQNLIDCALEREKSNTTKALSRPEYYSPLRAGRLNLNLCQTHRSEFNSEDGKNSCASEPRSFNSHCMVTMQNHVSSTLDTSGTPLRSYSVQNTPQKHASGTSLLSSLLGITETKYMAT